VSKNGPSSRIEVTVVEDSEQHQQWSSYLAEPSVAARLAVFFAEENRLLEEIQARVAEWTEAGVIFPLLYAIADSNRAFHLLATHQAMRGAYVIARVSFETIVNACFIMCEGEAAVDRARRHAQQKAFRDLDREIPGVGLRLMCNAKDAQALDPELQASLAIFTGNKGREITQWTPETVKERIDAIDRKYGPRASGGLNFGLFATYRYGSEIAHGSLFGALFSLGLTLPGTPRSDDELSAYVTTNISSLLWFLEKSINSLIYVVQRELGIQGIYEKSRALISRYQPGGRANPEAGAPSDKASQV
jgi:hypothetical protein